jgi:hypothetical protein
LSVVLGHYRVVLKFEWSTESIGEADER